MKLYIDPDGNILTRERLRAIRDDRIALANVASLARSPTTVTPPWMLVRKDAR